MPNNKTNPIAVTAVIILAVIALNYLEVIDVASIFGGAEDDDGDAGITAVTPALSFDCVDIHNPQTSVACTANYKLNNGPVKQDSDGSAVSVAAGDEVEYFINSSGYYGVHGSMTMPTKNIESVGISMLDYDTAPTIQVTNQLGTYGGLRNTAAQPERLAANGQPKPAVEVLSSYKDGIMGATLIVDFAKTNIDDVTSSKGVDGQEPDSLTHNSTVGRATADAFRSFVLGDLNADPAKGTSENFGLTINIDVSSTAYGSANMTLGITDKDWYRDQNGGFSYGYEEPVDNTNQGQAHHTFDTLFYTITA